MYWHNAVCYVLENMFTLSTADYNMVKKNHLTLYFYTADYNMV